METIELQNQLIKKILNTEDIQLLNYLRTLLDSNQSNEIYVLTESEKSLIKESIIDYKKGNIVSNDDIIERNEKWLEE